MDVLFVENGGIGDGWMGCFRVVRVYRGPFFLCTFLCSPSLPTISCFLREVENEYLQSVPSISKTIPCS
jgi:hypothetical protein